MKTYPIHTCLLASLLTLSPLALSAAQRTFATPEEAIQATINAADTTTRTLCWGSSGLPVKTSYNPAILPRTKTFAPNSPVRLTKSWNSNEIR